MKKKDNPFEMKECWIGAILSLFIPMPWALLGFGGISIPIISLLPRLSAGNNYAYAYLFGLMTVGFLIGWKVHIWRNKK